jgi:ribosomal protein S27E
MSKFLSVECNKCHKKSVVFGNATKQVLCECGEVLVEPTGGKSSVNAKILEVLS